MRNAFSEEITRLAENDERIVLLAGDIGNHLFDDFKKRFPKRFYNCGIAEANMTSMAAGMALYGLLPVTYTIAAFNTTRCLEQIRVDICYQNLHVIIVGVGAGLSYASLNATHHTLEDISFLRTLPNMTVICPGDAWEVRAATKAAINANGPIYLRLGKKNENLVHSKIPHFVIGKGIKISSGKDVCVLSTGNMLPIAVEVSDLLMNQRVSIQIVSMHTVKPLDLALLDEIFSSFGLVVTLEEHSKLGGLGGSIAEWLTEQDPQKGCLLILGTDDRFLYKAGGQDYSRSQYGLDVSQISKTIKNKLDSIKHSS